MGVGLSFENSHDAFFCELHALARTHGPVNHEPPRAGHTWWVRYSRRDLVPNRARPAVLHTGGGARPAVGLRLGCWCSPSEFRDRRIGTCPEFTVEAWTRAIYPRRLSKPTRSRFGDLFAARTSRT